MGTALEGFCAKARLVHSNQKSGLLVNPRGVFFQGVHQGQLWEVGETVYHKSHWGKSLGLTSAWDLVAAVQGMHLHGGQGWGRL